LNDLMPLAVIGRRDIKIKIWRESEAVIKHDALDPPGIYFFHCV